MVKRSSMKLIKNKVPYYRTVRKVIIKNNVMLVGLQGEIGEHASWGFPVDPVGQRQTGLWLITWHEALGAHAPMHGSKQRFVLLQASWGWQSLLKRHSGRQPVYGSPR